MDKIINLPDGNRAYVNSKLVGQISIYNNEIHEKYFQLKSGMCVLDVGACSAMFTLKAAKIVGSSGLVISVEPYKKAFDWLVKNVELNGYKNVLCINEGLWSSDGERLLNIQDIGHTSLLAKYTGEPGHTIIKKELVKISTIDSLMKKYNIKRFDFLKMDTEGSELEILKHLTKIFL